ncbi:nucleophile aminohydrolase [Ochromonadaceae sp. CCMP2298]|nr:nucleophile aminohydrolase [Ochromonadaceae sp. CCMP2298]
MFNIARVRFANVARNTLVGSSFGLRPEHLKQLSRNTTILCVRKDGRVVMAGDGQVSMGSTVVKGNAKKVRKIGEDILVGFAGSTADALTLLERLEKKLEEHPGQLMRACVELAKAWRSDKYLRRLEATLLVADAKNSFELTGNGDVLEPPVGALAIGSGGNFALCKWVLLRVVCYRTGCSGIVGIDGVIV